MDRLWWCDGTINPVNITMMGVAVQNFEMLCCIEKTFIDWQCMIEQLWAKREGLTN